MRKFTIVFLAAIAGSCLLPGDVSAKRIAHVIKFKASAAKVAEACDKAGGFHTGGAKNGGHGCEVSNCNGKGGNCTVDCDAKGNCTGTTPARTYSKGMSVEQVLGYGFESTANSKAPATNILHSSPGFSSQGPAATGTPLSRPAPSAPPSSGGGVIIR